MKIAVVGAGWAGCAAASQCLALGMDVTLFEAGHLAGGRARAVRDPQLGELDNGQHLLLGAYRKTLELMRRDIGANHIESSFKRLPLWLQSADSQFRLKSNVRAKKSLLADAMSIWTAKGLSLRDKWQITTLLSRLKRGITSLNPENRQTLTVAKWLTQERQTLGACRWLWHPLCIATLNTEPDQACASLFENVLRDSLLNGQADATDFLIPTRNLTDLWPKAVASKATTRWGHVVRTLVPETHGVTIDGTFFDACVLAVTPTSASRLVAAIHGFEALADDLASFEYRAIATCYVSLGNHNPLPAPLLMFDHAGLDANNLAQWVFDRSALMAEEARAQLSFVISCANDLPKTHDLVLAQTLVGQLKRALPTYRGTILDARCFQEKRATFAAKPGLARPGTKTPHPRIVMAGDWTDTGYPAVIEGAVMSGVKAANQLEAMRRHLL